MIEIEEEKIINVELAPEEHIEVNVENVSDISQFVVNEQIRIENEQQRVGNEISREEYINNLKQRIDNGEFNGKDGIDGLPGQDGKDGIDGLPGKDGENGQDGKDGKDGAIQYTAGDGITIENNVISCIGGTGTSDYHNLLNKPSINNIELDGNKSLSDLGIDQDFVKDTNYNHTDNNFTTQEKEKLSNLSNYNDTQIKQDITNLSNNKADKNEIPDVSNFITNATNNLANYYKKTETYTQTEVNNLISNINSFNVSVVEVLPTEMIDLHTIYLIPKTASENDNYDEYIYINNGWEHIGSTDIDLTNYVQKETGKGLSTNDLTDTLKTHYDTAYTKSHNHTNKSTLDTITTEKITSWDNKQDYLEAGDGIDISNGTISCTGYLEYDVIDTW